MENRLVLSDELFALMRTLKPGEATLPIILGKDEEGNALSLDLASTPHLLIGGEDEEAGIRILHSMVSTLWDKALSGKEILFVTDRPEAYEALDATFLKTDEAISTLEALLALRDERYNLFAEEGVRNINQYNRKLKDGGRGSEELFRRVLIIDEFAPLMEKEEKRFLFLLGKLASSCRAAGIHLVLKTGKVSAAIIDGNVKSNLQGRIATGVDSETKSRIILDEPGAELLEKNGFLATVTIGSEFTKGTAVEIPLPEEIPHHNLEAKERKVEVPDELYEEAKKIVRERQACSASYLQRRLLIGYNRALRLVEKMEEDGLVGPANGPDPREVYLDKF